MASFPFEQLPEDLSIRIVRLVGSTEAKHLSPLIMAGKVGREAVMKEEVLKVLPLSDFLVRPSLTYPDSSARAFFNGCILAKNETACYLEGIRLVAQEGRIVEGFKSLSAPRSHAPHIQFTRGIFLMCRGLHEQGLSRIRRVEEEVQCFDTVNAYGSQLIEYLLEM